VSDKLKKCVQLWPTEPNVQVLGMAMSNPAERWGDWGKSEQLCDACDWISTWILGAWGSLSNTLRNASYIL
jgi:hypothetical protein